MSVRRAAQWIRRGLETPAPWTGVPTWVDLLVYLAGFVVFFLVGVASNFYWGAMASIASYITWFVCQVKRP